MSEKVPGALVVAVVVLGLSGCQASDRAASAGSTRAATSPAATGDSAPPASPAPASPVTSAPAQALVTAAPAPRRVAAAAAPLLFPAPGGDGDSWKDTHGREYRLGLVNTPEYDECYGSQATAERKALVANGFRAKVYQTDRYGRSVSDVTLADGRDLNVYLARNGYANDKYLAQYRSENPSLAARLDPAFAAAKRARLGLWGACSSPAAASPQPLAAAPAPASSSCHPAYRTCIPVKGDGSGAGAANDLDCGDLREVVYLRQAGTDPYRLDSNGDGVGCESYG